MGLSSDLISQFVKVTKDDTKTKKETITYGTIVENEGTKYVQLDGSTILTPLSSIQSTADVDKGDRVTVMIKNHTATITGNLSNPSATYIINTVGDTEKVVDVISEFEIVVADKVTTKDLDAQKARIDELQADNVEIRKQLTANDAVIDDLEADNVEINKTLTANSGEINNLKTTKLDAEIAEATYATIANLDATNASIHNLGTTYATIAQLNATNAVVTGLSANKLNASDAAVTYANIDFSNIGKAAMEYFYSTSGLIKDVTVGDQTITGELVGVTIKGDLIEGGTVKADKLVIKGKDGLYYKLNIGAGATTSTEVTESDLQNGLHGTAIIAKTITAEKISVSDLVAFGATIGGFEIKNNAIHSTAKTSATNSTRGIYLDKEGQFAVGDSNNYVKYYEDSNGTYKLEIAAGSVLLGTKSVETAINDVRSAVDGIEVGGRNILLNSSTKKLTMHANATSTTEYGIEVDEWKTTEAMRIYGSGGTAQIFGVLSGTSCHKAGDENQQYALSVYVKNNHSTNPIIVSGNHITSSFTTVNPGAITRVEIAGFGNGWGFPQINFRTINVGDEFDFTYWHPKLEFGNKPTDWTPAPEDMATAEELTVAQNTANAANDNADSAKALIAQLSDSISMLVTDGNGTSLMTQTEDGWTFSTAGIQSSVNGISETLNALSASVGDVNSTVDILQQAVGDLGVIAEYVKIGTYEREPCIELGEGDSDFKLRITNTRMLFTEGSNVLAYFNNQSLHIKKAVVEEEFQQGGFVWKVRSNGNLGLTWKGGNG